MNRGAAERPITAAEIERKFMDNALLAVSSQRAAELRDMVLGMDGIKAMDLAEGLAGRG